MSFPQALFSTPTPFVRRGLDALARAVDLVMPLNAARRRELPDACRDLSALLTTERDGLERPYWTSPRLTSAYLRYFLPWNLVRLTALLPGLPLTAPATRPSGAEENGTATAGANDEFLIFDLGSGPCTFPLALWLARPDLRRLPVTVVASDSAPHPLDLGRRIFDALRADLDPASPWTLCTLRAPLHAAPRLLRGRPRLITLGNVLNELEERGRRGGSVRGRLAALLDDAARLLAPGGRLLAVEPGTRQGGRLTATLRDMALGCALRNDEDDEDRDGAENDWFEPAGGSGALRFRPLAPCSHSGPCPMSARGVTAWCHVNAPAEAAPTALTELSRAAGLAKESVSLAFLLLERLNDNAPLSARPADAPFRTGAPARLTARLISDAFVLPGAPGRARYACTEQGLALIPDAAFLPPGALCEATSTPRVDAKSGARIMTLPGREAAAPARTPSRDGASPRPAGQGRASGRPGERLRAAPAGRADKKRSTSKRTRKR